MQRIESSDNKKIKRLTSLKQKKVRLKENLFLMEGLKSISEAIAEKAGIEMILVSDAFAGKNEGFCVSLDKTDIPVYITKDYILEKCSNLKTPQGIVAAIEKPNHILQAISGCQRPVVVLDGISDPGNLGTIIRTADAFGFAAVLLTPGCADAYSPKTVQSTMGSILRMPCIEIKNEDIEKIKVFGYTVYGMDLAGTDMVGETFNDVMAAVIIGSESHGVSQRLLEKCDKRLRINMPGSAESLNASVAAGIILHKTAQTTNKG